MVAVLCAVLHLSRQALTLGAHDGSWDGRRRHFGSMLRHWQTVAGHTCCTTRYCAAHTLLVHLCCSRADHCCMRVLVRGAQRYLLELKMSLKRIKPAVDGAAAADTASADALPEQPVLPVVTVWLAHRSPRL